jgi:hypothetical protein
MPEGRLLGNAALGPLFALTLFVFLLRFFHRSF